MKCLKALGPLLACSALISTTAIYAAPNDYVRMATVEEGEHEIDFKWGNQKNKDGTRQSASSLGLGLGVNSWWFTEVYAKYQALPGESNAFDAWEWENRFQILETGKYPIDLGFLLEIERPKDRTEGYEITYGPLLQKEWGQVQGNLNILIQKHVQNTVAIDQIMQYQMQLKYRQSAKFEWGAQAFGSVGKPNNWDNTASQIHQFGPAIFGKIRLGQKQAIKWNAGLLHGTTAATPTTVLRVQAEYEF